VHTIVVAGTHSGVGKTSFTLGLIGALRRRGLVVQPFKVGPDFIDPAHHAVAAGRPSHNLDGWMLSRPANLELFASHTADADVAVVEGVMGLFDGSDSREETGSTAEMAKWLGAAVVLVIDASALARSAAALVHGYASFDGALRVEAVIANRVGSAAHAELIAAALENGPPLAGWLCSDTEVAIPERHLGLRLPGSPGTGDHVPALVEAVERGVDLDLLLAVTKGERPAPAVGAVPATPSARARIGVARDEAFSFYYEDNFALLRAAGAELVEFSPLRDELPAGLGGLYIGGGYPELHAAELSKNTTMRDAVKRFAAAGRPIYAECGGLIYLGRDLVTHGVSHEMCGLLPITTEFPGPLELAYCEAVTLAGPLGAGQVVRGHWFHNARASADSADVEAAYEVELISGRRVREGYVVGSVMASWVHLHFRSRPAIAAAFVAAASG
jgi:cobyrinic acid a,c-diamide synthase